MLPAASLASYDASAAKTSAPLLALASVDTASSLWQPVAWLASLDPAACRPAAACLLAECDSKGGAVACCPSGNAAG